MSELIRISGALLYTELLNRECWFTDDFKEMRFSIFSFEIIQDSRLYNLKDGGKGFSETSFVDYQSIPHIDAEDISFRQQRNENWEHANLIGICICLL